MIPIDLALCAVQSEHMYTCPECPPSENMCALPWLQGYYDTMDAGYIDEEGNIAVMARSDDVINVAGHRLSTGQLEEVRGP